MLRKACTALQHFHRSQQYAAILSNIKPYGVGPGDSIGLSVRYQGELLGIWDPKPQNRLAYYHPLWGCGVLISGHYIPRVREADPRKKTLKQKVLHVSNDARHAFSPNTGDSRVGNAVPLPQQPSLGKRLQPSKLTATPRTPSLPARQSGRAARPWAARPWAPAAPSPPLTGRP